MDDKVKDLVRTSLDKVKELSDADTIIGDPIKLDGVTIILFQRFPTALRQVVQTSRQNQVASFSAAARAAELQFSQSHLLLLQTAM